MNKTFKKLLISGASLLMLAGVSAGINNVVKPAHASAPTPNYYYSTKHKDNVYYLVNTRWDHDKKYHTYLLYGAMPKAMRNKHNIFDLYYGRKVFAESSIQPIHRHGHTYLPDYAGYVDNGSVEVNGHKGYVYLIYVNKRDIGRRVKNQHKANTNPKNFFTSQKQFLVPSRTGKSYHHAKRHYSKKSRLIRFRKGHKTYYARVYKVSND